MTAVAVIPPVRRVALCFITTALAAVLFRGPVAEGIATRGDVGFQSGDVGAALKFYRRAARFDVRSDVALERLTTLAMTSGDRALMAEVMPLADRHLQVRPDDAKVLQNRALLESKLGRRADADRDLARVAAITDDANVVEFGARRALARGDRRTAVTLYRRVLELQPGRASAREALARLGDS